uniref:EXPERA domain-containing protein n=1 Tax=Ciona savignyi TaxID=51511 RepID=H2Z5A0_CIOSA
MEVVKGFIGFYLVTGEPYLGTSYGTIALLWDTTGNLAMYLVIIYQIDNKLDHRNSVLYFGGTLVTSLCCLLVGGVTGNHGSNLYESSFLNIPYVIVPTYYLLDAFCQPRKFPKSLPSKETSDYKMLDIVLCVGLLLSCIFGLVRGIAALGSPMPLAAMYRAEYEPYLLDPSKFGVVWILFLMGVGGMLQVSIAFGLWRSGSRWVMDLSIIYAAVVIHGTFTHLIPQFCVGVSPEYHIPPESMLWVVAGNLFVPVVAVAVVMRCFAEPGYFKPSNQKLE